MASHVTVCPLPLIVCITSVRHLLRSGGLVTRVFGTLGTNACKVNMKDLKEKAVRGGFAKLCAQAANLVIRVGSLVVLARLLNPTDFGLVAMVTAVTGLLNLFRDFGLST